MQDGNHTTNTMNTSEARSISTLFFTALGLWLACAIVVAVAFDRWVALVAVPAALLMVCAARAERLSQAAQLVWPVLLLPGATFSFIGMMQSMGYGSLDGEPVAEQLGLRAAFFVCGLLLHFAAFFLLAMESRARDHPSGHIADQMP
jgi:di/tricarboxylate transporter